MLIYSKLKSETYSRITGVSACSRETLVTSVLSWSPKNAKCKSRFCLQVRKLVASLIPVLWKGSARFPLMGF